MDIELIREHFTKGWELLQQQRYEEAVVEYQVAVKNGPLVAYDPYYHLAICYQHRRMYSEAQGYYVSALSMNPADANVFYHAAKCLKDSGHLYAALPLYLKALSLDPELADAKYSLGLLHFFKGNWLEGWKGYSLRGLGSDRAKTEKLTDTGNLSRWLGGSVPAGSKILVTCEQGMGDVLMVFRFAQWLRQYFVQVGFTVHAPLVDLCKANAQEGVEVLRWDTAPVDLTKYTHTIALMDLPAAFGAAPDNVPNKPYLIAPTTNNLALQETLAELDNSKKLKVGIVWQGGKVSVANGRDVDFELLLPLIQDTQLSDKVQWVSLQKDIKVDGLSNFINAMLPVQSFVDTAALVDKLDLVISVDTSVAHLVGAMGKPVWMRGKSTTPWYPNMRIFNEPVPEGWVQVITAIGKSLRSKLGESTP